MKVIRLTDEHRQQYSQFVAAHESGSFMQSWQWGDFQAVTGKQPIRYGAFDNENKLVAAVQLLQTKIPRLPGTYLYAPYGPLIANHLQDSSQVAAELIGKIKSDNSRAWFIRIEPKDELPIDGKPTIHIQPASTLITDLSISEEELLAGMHQKTRYNIKVAAKHEVTTSSVHTSSQEADKMSQAIDLLTGTSKRQGYKSHPGSYYEQLLAYFTDQPESECKTSLYTAIVNDQCIAAAIMMDHGHTRTYLFGGSSNEHRSLMAPYSLHWQAIRDAKNAGLTSYDWWGTETASGTTPGFVQFKLRWGGTQKFYANARDIVLNSRWYHAYKALRKVNRLF